jgi:hypothetical protein
MVQGIASGRGAQGKVGYLSGTLMTSIEFPADTIPDTFSICSVSRYSNAVSNGQIVTAKDRQWFHGHKDGAGVAFYGKWMTPEIDAGMPGSDWLVMCGQNGNAPEILANGKDVSLKVVDRACTAYL